MPYANPIHPYLEALVASRGSDLHLVPGSLARIRVDGQLIQVARDADAGITEVTPQEARTLVLGTMPVHLHAHWDETRQVDYSYDAGPEIGRYRVNAYHQQRGPAAVFRRVPPAPGSLAELGIPTAVHSLAEAPNGLVLIAGPTGAGKSTTLAALVNHVNETLAGHILTIEDPVEFALHSRGCIVTQREIGTDVLSYASGVRAGLRQDPDVVMLGEVRDAEVLTRALEMAETGHLVLTTIHAESGPGAVARAVGLVDAAQQQATRERLAAGLRGIVAQRLLPREGGGRIAAFEVILRTTSVITRVRAGHFAALRSDMNDRSSGMTTLERSLAELVVSGEIREEVAAANANELDPFRAELAALRQRAGF